MYFSAFGAGAVVCSKGAELCSSHRRDPQVRHHGENYMVFDGAMQLAGVLVGFYPIVTLQYSSTACYQVSYHVQ